MKNPIQIRNKLYLFTLEFHFLTETIQKVEVINRYIPLWVTVTYDSLDNELHDI